MCRIDKTALVLIMATWRFDVIKSCLTHYSVQDERNILSVNTFLSYSKSKKVFHQPPQTLSTSF